MSFLKNLSPARLLDALCYISLILIFWVGMNYVNINMGGIGVQVPYNIFAWLGCSAFILAALLRIFWAGEIRLHVATYCYLAFFLLLLFPLVYSDRLFLSVEGLRFSGIGAGLLFFLAVQQFSTHSSNPRLLQVLLVSTVIQTAWGLLQYYFIFEPSRLFYRAEFGIPYGVFQQVNVFAIYLAFGSILALYFWSKAKGSLLWWGVCVGALLFLNAHLAVLSSAGTALFTGGVSITGYLAYLRFKGRPAKWILAFAVSLIAGYSAPKSWFDIRPERLSNTESINQELPQREGGRSGAESSILPTGGLRGPDADQAAASLVESVTSSSLTSSLSSFLGTRPTIYVVATKMFLDEFWRGHGVGTFRKQYLLYQGEYLKEHPGAPAEFNLHHPHNELLYWAIELGFLSLMAFFFLVWSWLKMARSGLLKLEVLLITSPLILHSLVELPFYHSAAHWLGFVLVLAASGDPRYVRIFKVPRLGVAMVAVVGLGGALRAWIFLLSTYFALQMFVNFNAGGRENVAYLFNIKNPAAFQQRYEFELFQWKLRQANKLGEVNTQDLNNFLVWSFSVIQYAPLPGIYESFISALMIAGKFDAAQKYLDEAKLMYPDHEELTALQEKLAMREVRG